MKQKGLRIMTLLLSVVLCLTALPVYANYNGSSLNNATQEFLLTDTEVWTPEDETITDITPALLSILKTAVLPESDKPDVITDQMI